jgi:hypothetical protein
LGYIDSGKRAHGAKQKIKMMGAKLQPEQQIGNKCGALKPAIRLAARTSVMPSDEYSN